MSRQTPSAALPIAYGVVRILIVANWLFGAAILTFLALSVNTELIVSAFHLTPSADAYRLIWGMRAIAVAGICATPLHYVFLKRLLEIVETVREGDPFVAENASRLRTMAWMLVALQCLSLIVGAIASAVSTKTFPLHIDAGFSINGWLAVLLTFLLAQVFAEGTFLREDVKGTI